MKPETRPPTGGKKTPPSLGVDAAEATARTPLDDARTAQEAARPARPRWYRNALAVAAEHGSIVSAGARITYRVWGPEGAPSLVLLHGGAAHSRWWDHIAPLLAAGRRVAALDMSGHGDSDRRDHYTPDLWAQEAVAVAHAIGGPRPPVLIGHSLGGFVALRAGLLSGAELSGVAAIDSPLKLDPPRDQPAGRHSEGPRTYPSLREALSRFRPIPADGPVLDYVVEHIARTSLQKVPEGWTWKFDPRIFSHSRPTPVADRALSCRAALFRAEHGVEAAAGADVVHDCLGRQVPVIELANAHHHVMLDEPLALVAAMRTLLSQWDTEGH